MKLSGIAFLLLSTAVVASDSHPPSGPSRRPIATPAERLVRTGGASSIATDGNEFFATWTDGLADASGTLFNSRGDVRLELPVVATWQPESYPVAVWNGVEYVALVSAGPLGVFATRVSPAGELRGAGSPLQGYPWSQPSLVWNGSAYAYSLLDGSQTLTVYFIDPTFTVVKGVPIGKVNGVYHARVATDGSRFLVAWTEVVGPQTEIAVQVFDGVGEPIGPPQTLETAAFETHGLLLPDIAWNGTSYTMMWAAGSLKGALIANDGSLRSRFDVPGGTRPHTVSIGWDGFAHLVLWTELSGEMNPDGTLRQRPRAALLTSSGALMETIPIEGGSMWGPGRATIASNGDVFLVSWFAERFIISSTQTPRIQRREPFMTTAHAAQSAATIAVGTTNVLAAWSEASRIYIGRLSKGGEPLDGSGIAISNEGGTVKSVTASGGIYLVVWGDTTAKAVRVTESGQVLDREPIVLPGDGALVTADPSGFRIVSTISIPERAPFLRRALLTAAIPRSGPVNVSPSDILFPSTLTQAAYAVFWNGTGYTLLWSQYTSQPCYGRFCPPPQHELRASFLNQRGEPVTVTTRAVAANVAPLDVLHASDNTLLIVWWQLSEGLRTQRLLMTGEPIAPPARLTTNPSVAYGVSLAETRSGFLVAYTVRSITYPWTWSDIRAVSLDCNGVQRGEETILISGNDLPALSRVESDGENVWLSYVVSWQPRPAAHDRAVSRAYVHLLTPRGRAVAH